MNLHALKLFNPPCCTEFQSGYIVYHDDTIDYRINEPAMDDTVSLINLMAAKELEAQKKLMSSKPSRINIFDPIIGISEWFTI